MKNCIKCERPISDDAKFCTKCGTKQPAKEPLVFCAHCGKKLPSDAIYCAYCAQPVHPETARPVHFFVARNTTGVVATIAEREKMFSLFWAVVATLQVICGCIILPYDIFSGLVFLGIAALNFWGAYKSFTFAKQIQIEPVGIIQRYEKINAFAITLVYNIFIFILGLLSEAPLPIIIGLAAVIVSVLDIRLRAFVLQNRDELAQLEL